MTSTLPHDIREFLAGYPELDDDDKLNANFAFYSNTLRCRPDDLLIEEIHDRRVVASLRRSLFCTYCDWNKAGRGTTTPWNINTVSSSGFSLFASMGSIIKLNLSNFTRSKE